MTRGKINFILEDMNMPVCPKCGVEVAADAKTCPACGVALGEAPKTEAPKEEKKFTMDSVKKLNDTKDFTADMDAEDIEKNKIFSLFSYLGILFLVPLLACQDSKYARFHVHQGILFLIFNIASGLVSGVLGGVTAAIVAIFAFLGEVGAIIGWIIGALLGLVTGLIGLVLSVASIVLLIIGIMNAVTGRATELPVIGKYRLLK